MNGSLTISRITRVDESATTTPGAATPGARAQSPKPAPPKAKDPTAQPTQTACNSSRTTAKT